jgi:hypothetical protein
MFYLWFTGHGSDFNRSCPRNGNTNFRVSNTNFRVSNTNFRVSNKILGLVELAETLVCFFIYSSVLLIIVLLVVNKL